MTNPSRMSPLTALFLGIFIVGGFGIASLTLIIMQGMRMVHSEVSNVLGLAERTIEGLPDLIDSLPPSVTGLLGERRATYASNLEVAVSLASDDRGTGRRPALSVINKGDEIVTLLAVRVSALDRGGAAIREWTEVVATPLALDGDWRGPILPRSTRYVVMNDGWSLPNSRTENVTAVWEIADIRVEARAEDCDRAVTASR